MPIAGKKIAATMQNGIVENGVCLSASVNGSHDVWSSNESDSSSADHLVVMVHGIMGSAADWKFGAEQFVKMFPDKVFVHCSERNGSRLTLDGVDVMGERLAEEVVELTQRKPNLRKISFIGHSVGGLVARYAIGRLYRPPRSESSEHSSPNGSEKDPRSKLCGLEPMNFITVATPHLGSRGNKQVPFLFGVPAFEKVASAVIHLIFKRTGLHCVVLDVGWCIQMWAMTILSAGEHHALDVTVNCQSGKILLMKNIHILFMKNIVRLMMPSSAILLQWKMMALTSLKGNY